MKVRCIDDLGMTALEVGRVYGGELKFDHWYKEKRWYLEGEKFRKFCFSEKAFEIVREDNKMQEKTFREVISTIKEGEVWESQDKTIKHHADGIQIYHKNREKLTPSMLLLDVDKFKLKRKEYTFEEAFKAYENGKEIESCVSVEVYSLEREKRKLQAILFDIEEIRGKWYINN
ncbi:MAG: hypothetical protein E6585_23840 [Serratia marcescens]|nr:hypothetical protein [Serratia marcescens]